MREAALRTGKMSIQGVQPKLSARLRVKDGRFDVVDTGGHYIIKPQNPAYPELPQNEALTMRMAGVCGIEVPLHGLLRCVDGSLSYFIRRFDRAGRKERLAVEDFAQLSDRNRDTKYDSSVERVVDALHFCTFPVVERVRFFRRFLFNFLVGNEDMHLKNYSLITRAGRVELAPGYDFLSTSTTYRMMGKSLEELEESALPLTGKKRGLTRKNLLKYLGCERLGLSDTVVMDVAGKLLGKQDEWARMIGQSHLSDEGKQIYLNLLRERCSRMGSW